MVPIPSNTLRVPGGEIAYEVRGSGPVLLMISGGSGSSSGYASMADYLARHYTVVLYDRLGGSEATYEPLLNFVGVFYEKRQTASFHKTLPFLLPNLSVKMNG